MKRSLDLQIRSHIAAYSSGADSLQQFLDWFMDAAEEAYEVGDLALVDLVDSVKLYWAEFTNGDLTEVVLRELLSPLSDTYHVAYRYATEQGEQVQTEQQSSSLTQPLEFHKTTPATEVCTYFDANTQSLRQPLSLVDDSQRNASYELSVK